MGTRSLIRVYLRSLGVLRWVTSVYQQFDGYPEVVGLELLDWLNFINAQQRSAAWLAEMLVIELRTAKPDVAAYLAQLPRDEVDTLYIEWVYDVVVDEKRKELLIRVWDSELRNTRFEGSLSGAFAWMHGGPYDANNIPVPVDLERPPRRSVRIHRNEHSQHSRRGRA